MRKFCLLLILSLALPVFCLLQAVEPPKKEIRAVWLTTVYGLDWPHKPATTEAGRKAQQQALLDTWTGFKKRILIWSSFRLA